MKRNSSVVPWLGLPLVALALALGMLVGACGDDAGTSTEIPEGCGDGVIDSGEACDDGNNDDSDGCDMACTLETGWTCTGQPSVCDRPAGCGDGAIDAGEACDDGNPTAGDGCDDSCTVEAGWTCTGQPSVCTGGSTGACGDGAIDAGEACDDGNTAAADGCDDMCAVESGWTCSGAPSQCTASTTGTCGDGTMDSGEACDDGANGDDCDGCLDDCTTHVSACGDTYVCGAEECDDGNTAAGDGCSDTCTNEGATSCGDGVKQAGEGCDLGSANSDSRPGDCSSVCRTDCTCPGCGDGVADLALGEQCDDGNTTTGDGCDDSCQLEVGAACGNGVLEAANLESCDDGNTSDGDGCSATCQFEAIGTGCGSGSTDSDEVCDDGLQVCADGTTACTQDSDCPAGAAPQVCLPANGDSCNTTCNFQNVADTFIHTGPGGVTLSADNTYLWMANEYTGEIRRLDVGACITHHAGLPGGQKCQDASGSLGCQNPCTDELVASVASPTGQQHLGASYVVSDGSKAWWGANGGPNCSGATEAYIYELDLAACDAAISGGGDCSSLATVAAGGAIGYADGNGTSAQVQGMRGLTYYDGYVYFLDGGCGTLRRFDPASKDVTTIVGDPSCPANQTFQEGPGNMLPSAGGASLLSPRYMSSDNSGFLYISDNFDHTISRYNVHTNYLERFVGTPNQSGYADHWDPAQARFARPRDVTSDGTSLFVADFNNYTIRQVDLTTGRTTTMVGVPSPGTNPDNKCDLFFGQGATAGTGPRFHKPMEMAYHYPTGSLFFYTGGGAGANCFGSPACTPSEVLNTVWRVR